MKRSSGPSTVKAATAPASERSSVSTRTPSLSSSGLDSRAVAITSQPSSEYCRANSRPRPRFAPVTRTLGMGAPIFPSLREGDGSVEQAGDRRLVGNALHRLAEQGRHAEPADLAAFGVRFAAPDRVGDDELAELGLGNARGGSARQDSVRAVSEDLGRAFLLERGGGVAERARRID